MPRTPPWQISPAISVGARLLWAGELDRAREVLRREYDELSRQGAFMKLPFMLLLALFDVEWRAGRWTEAEAYVEEASAILEDAAPGGAHVVAYARLLSPGPSVASTKPGASWPRRCASPSGTTNVNAARPLGARSCRARRGDAAAAWQALEGLPEALDAFGIAEPGLASDPPGRRRDAGRARPGRGGGSCPAAARGAGGSTRHRWATPAALRCRALVLLAREHADEAADAAERAAELEKVGFPLDHARSLLTAGAARRRAGQRREPLTY